MLNRIAITLAALGFLLAAGNAASGYGGRDFSGSYVIYGAYPDPKEAVPPTPGDTKVAFSLRGAAAKDMFDAIGPAARERSRGEERCEGNRAIRTRALDTIQCRYHPKDGYWCTFGFDLSTGLGTWGKAGDAGCS
jgi:hypothetical protein